MVLKSTERKKKEEEHYVKGIYMYKGGMRKGNQ